MMKLYGLTGGAASGKSTVASMLAARGAAIIDTDELAHQLSHPPSPALDAIKARFGEGFLLADGSMDRPQMRAHVLAHPAARRELENIFHPLIRAAAEQHLQALGQELPYAVLVVPLLFETKAFLPLVDLSIVVDCDEAEQKVRLRQRTGLTEIQIAQLLAAQYSRAQRLEHADIILHNNGDIAQLEAEVNRLHHALSSRGTLSDQA